MPHCDICSNECTILEGKSGACGRYFARNGVIEELFADQYLVACPISAETMPMLHACPGATLFQISTMGCNLSCTGCISTVLVRKTNSGNRLLKHIAPSRVVDLAIEHGCMGIVFLMNDPLASYFTFTRVAQEARARGLIVGCSTNALFSQTSLDRIMPLLSFVNIGMKGMWDKAYQECGAASADPVLKNMKILHKGGVHIEISCMLRTDNKEEIKALASYVSSLSPSIPFQVMRFIPLEKADISLEPSIREAEDFCRELRQILHFVYLFNSPGTELLDTRCPACNRLVFKRDFYGPMGAKLLSSKEECPQTGQCPECGHDLHIKGDSWAINFSEKGFEGGYPFTRALEMVEAMLVTLGLSKPDDMVTAWEALLQKGGLQAFHHDVQEPYSYMASLLGFAKICGKTDEAEALVSYIKEKIATIKTSLSEISRKPRVYYAMGTPLFALNSGRLENRLVEYSGGYSVNTRLKGEGRPGHTITVEQLNDLNPEVIFISAFISDPAPLFHRKCLELGIVADAVKNSRIYNHPSPGWDFGSPRWILGMINIATILHPDRCHLDVMAEAREFYRLFYKMDFSPLTVNRSFSNPSQNWG